VTADVRVVEHSTNENCVHLNYKVADTNEMQAESAKGMKQAVEFNLVLLWLSHRCFSDF
jgi:hypothetical protein